jgi:long-chain acyl-CoA synthetase
MSKIHTVQPGFYGEGSVDVSSSLPEESPIRRCAITKDKLVTQPFEGIDTVADIISYSARTHGNRKALGWRDVIQVIEEEKEVTKVVDGKEVTQKKLWKYFELSDYKYLSYIELKEAISEVSRALIDLGITKDDVFNVYAQTRYVTAWSVVWLHLFIDSI